ncbi:MAG: hypothetical protein C5B47_04765 [Verrucomicrobia bacterium]|nr:MAG: hypothetical protein C5B47_04765 [Verrucomicrobiota bacterium]
MRAHSSYPNGFLGQKVSPFCSKVVLEREKGKVSANNLLRVRQIRYLLSLPGIVGMGVSALALFIGFRMRA